MLFAFAAVPGIAFDCEAWHSRRAGGRPDAHRNRWCTARCPAEIDWLYAMTIAMGAGVAIMQVSMPPAVRAWLPRRIGFATAVYTNGLLIGEILPVALMLPLVLPLAGGHWQWGFVIWSVPVAIIAMLVTTLAPNQAPANGSTTRRRWWPDWRNSLIWRLGIMLGTVNATYFATNAFIPDYLHSNGQGEWISAALSGLNIGQLPASFLLLAFASRLEGQSVALRRLRCASGDSSDGYRIWFRPLDGRSCHVARFRRRGNIGPGAGASTIVESAR